MKIWRINGFRVSVYRCWLGWSAEHWQDGRRVTGYDKSLRSLRRGVHVITDPNNRAAIAALRDV